MAEHNSFWVTSGSRLCISREVEERKEWRGERSEGERRVEEREEWREKVREGGRGKEEGREEKDRGNERV